MSELGEKTFATVRAILDLFPDSGVQIEQWGSALWLRPQGENVFPVTLYDEEHEVMVSCERWHTHETDPEQAAFCAIWLLTPYYRIIHEVKGGNLAAAWLETYDADGWTPDEPVYFLNPENALDWQTAHGESFVHRVHQQAVLPPPVPFEVVAPGAVLDEDGLPPGTVLGSTVSGPVEPIGPSLFDPEGD